MEHTNCYQKAFLKINRWPKDREEILTKDCYTQYIKNLL